MTTSFDHDDDEYDDVVYVDQAELGCTWCLGGFAPAGAHHVLGLVYIACRHCTDTCSCCTGLGIFPADTTCQHCLAEALTAVGYTATFCHSCAGVLTVERADTPTNTPDDDPPWEVTS